MIKCRIAVRKYSNAKDKICDDEIIIERNCDRRRRRKKKVRIVYLGGCRSTFERFVHVARDSVVAMIRLSTAVMNASRCCNLSFVARNLHDGWISTLPSITSLFTDFSEFSSNLSFDSLSRRIINDQRVVVARLNWVTEKERDIAFLRSNDVLRNRFVI